MSASWDEVVQSNYNEGHTPTSVTASQSASTSVTEPVFDFDKFLFDFSNCTRAKKVEVFTDALNYYMSKVYSGSFDVSKAERVASLALSAQIEISDLLSDAECRVKQAKYDVELVESEVALRIRSEAETRITEVALKQKVIIDSSVTSAKNKILKCEKNSKKWNYVFNIFKEAHIFFRNLAK
jgi:hypothetical protein